MPEVGTLFHHLPHPRTRKVLEGTSVAPRPMDEAREGFNGKLGLLITTSVGTMLAAYLFVVLALVSLPAALRSGDTLVIVGWTAQTFLQLVLLPIIIVGQNIQARASDKRAQDTYNDAEAVLHECIQIQAHLTAQDEFQQTQIAELRTLLEAVRQRPTA